MPGVRFPRKPLAVYTNPQDGRIVSITVVDEDFEQDDPVGDYQFTVGELVKAPVQELSLVAEAGQLRAGGVLVLKVSAQRF